MLRTLVTATATAALCFASVTPAFAQHYNGFNAPLGATATANLRIPFGPKAKSKPSYGVTLGFGRTMGFGADGLPVTRQMRLADLRFSESGKLSQAQVASFDLANLDQDRRLNLMGGAGKKTWLLLGGIVVAGVAICLAADCFEDDEEDTPNSPGTSTPGM